jgi:urease accessory protein
VTAQRVARRRPAGLAIVLLAVLATPAWAHSPIPGIGNFYSGALHPFISPAHLIALLALGLAIGQRAYGALARAKPPLVTVAAGLAAGLMLHAAAGDPDTDRLLLVGAAGTGLLVAAAWPLPVALEVLLAAAIGLAVGLASGPTGVEGRTRYTMLAGTGLAATLLVGYVTVMVSVTEQPWLRIAVRVVGSWLAASSLLVLALNFAAHRGASA